MNQLEWTKGSDNRLWDSTGTYFILTRPDRYRDLYQRVSDYGDVRLNGGRLSLQAAKDMAQHFKDTTKIENVPDMPEAVLVSNHQVEPFLMEPITLEPNNLANHPSSEKLHPCCSDPGCPNCGGYGIVVYDDNPTVIDTVPALVMGSAESRTKPVMGSGARKLDEIEAMRKIKAAGGPEELEWITEPASKGPLGVRMATYWETACERYAVVCVSSGGTDPEYAALRIEKDGELKKHLPIEHEPESKTRVKYHHRMEPALLAVETFHGKAMDLDQVHSNRVHFLKSIDASKSGAYNGGDTTDGVTPSKGEGARAPKDKTPAPRKIDEDEDKASSKEKKTVYVKENRVRRMFQAMGYGKAKDWDLNRLESKANSLASLADDAETPEGEELETFREISEALQEDDVIKIRPNDTDADDTDGDEDDRLSNDGEDDEITKEKTVTATATCRRKHATNGTVHTDSPSKKKSADSPWEETKSPRLVPLTAKLASQYATMDRFPRDREVKANLKAYLAKEIKEGRFRGAEWACCHVRETGVTYRMNGKHTSTIFHEMFEAGEDVPDTNILVREYACDTMEEASALFATFDAKQNSRSKADVIRGFAVADKATADMPPRLLSILTASVAYNTYGDKYRNLSPADQARLLLLNTEFAGWVKDLIGTAKQCREFKHLVRLAVVASMQKTWETDADDATEFWTELRDDSDAPKNAPQRVLYRWLKDTKIGARDVVERISEKEVMSKCLQAWNAWRKKENTVKFSKFNKDAELPEAK